MKKNMTPEFLQRRSMLYNGKDVNRLNQKQNDEIRELIVRGYMEVTEDLMARGWVQVARMLKEPG